MEKIYQTVALTFYNYCSKGKNVEDVLLVTKSIMTVYELGTSGRGTILSDNVRVLGSNPGTTHTHTHTLTLHF
jgi:hypothetical protein